ncbi:hypothetical protein RRG08_022587 [Elysia crispata]|uniref:Uncharacterized protein n=1 Tax=Elysia crispata TaxID=231223 RepID=A0AAE0Z3H5_9GAST|nr:hypothetical protein RRG08_022587 [Elysia crispata]
MYLVLFRVTLVGCIDKETTFVFAGTAGRTIGWLFRGEAGDGVQNKYRALDGASIDPPSIKVDSQRDSPSPIMSIPIARPSVGDSSSSLAQPNDGPPMSTTYATVSLGRFRLINNSKLIRARLVPLDIYLKACFLVAR